MRRDELDLLQVRGMTGRGGAETDPPTAADQVTRLYQTHGMDLLRIAAVMLGSRTAAEDIVQEAFCGLYRKWNRLADADNALPYVRSAVMNRCRSELRRQARLEPGHCQVDHFPRARCAGPKTRGTVMNIADDRLRAAARDAARIFPSGGDLAPLRLPEGTSGYGHQRGRAARRQAVSGPSPRSHPAYSACSRCNRRHRHRRRRGAAPVS
jgi:RNA polymerase sigma factor (sigma-70 family)